MVYCGRPSRGCQNCKNRRIKCDETRPRCLNCEKTSRECPGFPEEVDLIFRNETPGVSRKARKTSSSGPSTAASPPTAPPPPAALKKGDSTGSDEYDVPTTHNSRKRRRRDTQPSIPENTEPVSPRTTSKQTPSLSQFQYEFQLDSTIEQQAITFFFKNFVLSPRTTDATRGYLEVAASMFDDMKEGSALRLATQAVAISAFANEPQRGQLRQLAARHYGRALAATQMAIQDPKEAIGDSTLLSILLFALYESITPSDHSTPCWTKHISGAVAIVKARGTQQFQSPQSMALFRSVRAQMLAHAIHQHKPIDDFPGPKGWLSDLPDNHLGTLKSFEGSIAPPRFVKNGKYLFAQEKTAQSTREITDLLEQALATQQTLRSWEQHMPAKWTHRSPSSVSYSLELDQIDDMDAWPGPIHTYEDIDIASIRNNSRVNQMLCSSIIIESLRWLDSDDCTNDTRYRTAKHRVQSLVDEICYSVPFHLWGQIIGKNATGEVYSRNMSEAIGGYLLIWPLYVAANTPCIPDIQKRWLKGRMRAIARHYGPEQRRFLNPLEGNKIDVGDLISKTASCASPSLRHDSLRRGENQGSVHLHIVCRVPADEWSLAEPSRRNTHPSFDLQKDGSLLVDPALLAITSPKQPMRDNTSIDTITPARTALVPAS